ncbi:MAG: hypothetical protein E4H01_04215 [Lysobacterales bacterium]|nr:MAG: hypothetical protein E4H01_04215 [Xanthomonadales bacterium]
MNISIDPAIILKLGFLQLTHCRVESSSDGLRKTYEDVARVAGERFSSITLAEHPVSKGVRRLFNSVGMDSSRHRPSSEALVRRITKGKGLYYINCIVDINNLCSIESLFPLGAYDQACINGDVTIRLGTSNDVYCGIGKEINVVGKLVSADTEGAFGSPIADSERTKITEHTHEVLILLYAPPSCEDSEVRDTLKRFADLASVYAGAQTVTSGIRTVS